MANVAINGMGRIGRATLRVVMDTPELNLVGVNDIADPENIAYLVKHDSVYGRYPADVSYSDGKLHVGDEAIPFYSERNPADLPWDELGVDIVFESTGVFTTTEKASAHIEGGAKYVLISAPAKDETPTVVYGVNSEDEGTNIISCASCTTNSITPVVEVLGRKFGIAKAILTTVHGYTASQGIVDMPHKAWVRGRTAAINIVPTTTGAAKATTKALPQYAGKFDGIAMRVPTPVGSVSDLTFLLETDVTEDEVNAALREAADNEYKDVMAYTDIPFVSTDIIGDPHGSIVDLSMTKVVDGNLVKVLAWYDNEWGYTNQMVRKAKEIAAR